ncbi:hypothetical protein [Roseobacter litoralis]|uniref:hypothetical protein n=1 Tax=Roseobacter litoralis TaxID=42443 RepID=UPI0024947ECF|nr:hypothetical protein [Roseobacter litoralis]
MMVYPGTPIYEQMTIDIGELESAKPVPMIYEMHPEAEALNQMFSDLSKLWSQVDVELDKAEFRISSLTGIEYQQKYFELRSQEKEVARSLFELARASFKTGNVVSDEVSFSALHERIKGI